MVMFQPMNQRVQESPPKYYRIITGEIKYSNRETLSLVLQVLLS